MTVTNQELEDHICTWDDFMAHSLVKSALTDSRSFLLFRGQADAELNLCPSLLVAVREAVGIDPTKVIPTKTALAFEEAARKEFEAQAHLYFGPAFSSTTPTNVHWWMHMQHYGTPTRLLDWTRSPFVAAYFACEKHPGRDGAVWAFDVRIDNFSMPLSFRKISSAAERSSIHRLFENPLADRKLCFLNTGLRNERMVAQQGVFMLSYNVAVEHDQILREIISSEPKNIDKCRKLRIAANLKTRMIHSLLAMNINARSLFPGIDGLGKSVAEMVRFDAFPGNRTRPW